MKKFRAAAFILSAAIAMSPVIACASASATILRARWEKASYEDLLEAHQLIEQRLMELDETWTTSALPTAAPKKQEMVYVSKSGKKYHRLSSCSNMKTPREITLEEALKAGYDACKKCY